MYIFYLRAQSENTFHIPPPSASTSSASSTSCIVNHCNNCVTMSPSTIPFLFHLAPLPPSEIPAHPSIPYPIPPSTNGETTDSRPPLPIFLHAALTQAREFITTTIPDKSFTVNPKLRDSPPSSAQVQVLTGTVKYTPLTSKGRAADSKEVKWFARRTIHDNRAVSGTASFEEFVHGLKDDHLLNEMEYEPNITAVEDIAKWDCSAVEIEGGWSGLAASRKHIYFIHPSSFKYFAPISNPVIPPRPPSFCRLKLTRGIFATLSQPRNPHLPACKSHLPACIPRPRNNRLYSLRISNVNPAMWFYKHSTAHTLLRRPILLATQGCHSGKICRSRAGPDSPRCGRQRWAGQARVDNGYKLQGWRMDS